MHSNVSFSEQLSFCSFNTVSRFVVTYRLVSIYILKYGMKLLVHSQIFMMGLHFAVCVITCTCCDKSHSMLVKEAPAVFALEFCTTGKCCWNFIAHRANHPGATHPGFEWSYTEWKGVHPPWPFRVESISMAMGHINEDVMTWKFFRIFIDRSPTDFIHVSVKQSVLVFFVDSPNELCWIDNRVVCERRRHGVMT